MVTVYILIFTGKVPVSEIVVTVEFGGERVHLSSLQFLLSNLLSIIALALRSNLYDFYRLALTGYDLNEYGLSTIQKVHGAV